MAALNEKVNTDLVIKQTVITSGAINTGDVDLSNYYTKYEIDNMIPTDYITEIPDEYVTDSELNEKGYLTEIPSDYIKDEALNNYYTKEEVDNKISSSGTFDPSLYYTKTEVDALIPTDYLTEIPEEYITEEELNAKGYLTEHQSLEGYALKTDIPDVSTLATKDELNNYQPKGDYLTEEDLDVYITEEELDARGYLTQHQSLDNYYTKSEVDNKIASGGTFDPTQYYTKNDIDSKGYLTEHQDLSDYALKTDIPTDYLTEIPAEYITESELEAKGYLTEHQSLDNYYTKEEVNAKVAEGGTFDPTLYYTKTEVDSKIPTDYLTEIPAEYITEDELNAKGYLTEHLDISGKQDVIADLETIRSGAALGATAIQEHQSLADYALKSELPTDYITEIPEEYITEDELNSKGYLTEHQDLSNYALKTDIPDTSNFATKDELPEEYDDTAITNRVTALETSLGNIDTLLDNINGEAV